MLLPLLLLMFAPAPQALDPTLTPTSGAITVATAQGRGVQIYQCVRESGTYAWLFKNPEATLFEPSSGNRLGMHGAGPTWTWTDGSSITGTALAKMPSPDASSVPWLLVKTHSVATKDGVLAHVGLVRRSDTKGGQAPAAGCDAQHGDTILRVPYTATYTFYTLPGAPSEQR